MAGAKIFLGSANNRPAHMQQCVHGMLLESIKTGSEDQMISNKAHRQLVHRNRRTLARAILGHSRDERHNLLES